ncbi:hypothetical protein DFP72DRAFT_851304 [Ephemerocybe angulata]|uniref:Uncharacterized protein n=1 Tax=Ephemerocybe angulata TaxID=980116 RepID=A0A8H6HPG2_9AGAR|nr:hypothetical protein DFP72DRAFT_851304 [Tulosesus angulatus]
MWAIVDFPVNLQTTRPEETATPASRLSKHSGGRQMTLRKKLEATRCPDGGWRGDSRNPEQHALWTSGTGKAHAHDRWEKSRWKKIDYWRLLEGVDAAAQGYQIKDGTEESQARSRSRLGTMVRLRYLLSPYWIGVAVSGLGHLAAAVLKLGPASSDGALRAAKGPGAVRESHIDISFELPQTQRCRESRHQVHLINGELASAQVLYDSRSFTKHISNCAGLSNQSVSKRKTGVVLDSPFTAPGLVECCVRLRGGTRAKATTSAKVLPQDQLYATFKDASGGVVEWTEHLVSLLVHICEVYGIQRKGREWFTAAEVLGVNCHTITEGWGLGSIACKAAMGAKITHVKDTVWPSSFSLWTNVRKRSFFQVDPFSSRRCGAKAEMTTECKNGLTDDTGSIMLRCARYQPSDGTNP